MFLNSLFFNKQKKMVFKRVNKKGRIHSSDSSKYLWVALVLAVGFASVFYLFPDDQSLTGAFGHEHGGLADGMAVGFVGDAGEAMDVSPLVDGAVQEGSSIHFEGMFAHPFLETLSQINYPLYLRLSSEFSLLELNSFAVTFYNEGSLTEDQYDELDELGYSKILVDYYCQKIVTVASQQLELVLIT